jgi:hypothetical protein
VRRGGGEQTTAHERGTAVRLRPYIECVRRTGRNVKHWQNGERCFRWTAAGMLEAEQQFRRVIGYQDLAKLAAAVEREVTLPQPTTLGPRRPLSSPPRSQFTRTVTEVPHRPGHPRGTSSRRDTTA